MGRAAFVQIHTSREAELVERLEQDLTGAFPEGAGAVSGGERLLLPTRAYLKFEQR